MPLTLCKLFVLTGLSERVCYLPLCFHQKLEFTSCLSPSFSLIEVTKLKKTGTRFKKTEECRRQVIPMLIKTAMAYEKIGPSTGLCGKKSGLYKMHAFVYFREKKYCLIQIFICSTLKLRGKVIIITMSKGHLISFNLTKHSG